VRSQWFQFLLRIRMPHSTATVRLRLLGDVSRIMRQFERLPGPSHIATQHLLAGSYPCRYPLVILRRVIVCIEPGTTRQSLYTYVPKEAHGIWRINIEYILYSLFRSIPS